MASASSRNQLLNNAREEAEKNRQSLIQYGATCANYVTTVFLLDTSTSMSGEGLEQMKKSFKDIINEFSKHPSIAENVSVITFGEEVKIRHYYSNDYGSITRCVDDLECSGGSPLEAGIIMCLSGIWSAPYCNMGPFHVRTRIVIITDGIPTQYDTRKYLEIYESHGCNETTASVIDIVRQIGRLNPIFCIPVGSNPDICFLGTVAMESSGGKIILKQKAQQFGRYAINMMLASTAIQRIPDECQFSREAIKLEVSRLQSVSEEDLDDICEIIENRDAYRSLMELREEDERELEKEYEERYADMPCVGTRVRRGPDWTWKNQDGHGAGTVVGHSQRVGWIRVEWDTGLELPYRYGNNGLFTEYDIEPYDEPRILEDQPIAVGCLVRRGRDWKWGDQDGGEGQIGTVYRLKTLTEIYVRWPNGNKSNYRFGYKQKFDVELCDPFDPDVADSLKKQTEGKTAGPSSCEDKISGHGNARKAVVTYFRNDSISYNSNSKESVLEPPGKKSDIATIMNKQTGISDHSSDTRSYRIWQWRGQNGVWNEFTKEANKTIESFNSKPTMATCIIDLNGHLCRIHLKKKKMVNTITKEVTDIRLKDEDIPSNF